MPNIFQELPDNIAVEHFETITTGQNVRIERIVSNENTTNEGEWYDQSQKEWVIVLEGSGSIEIEEGRSVTLNKGDHLLIEKQERHRVTHTDPNTIWLAVHFD